MTTTTHEATARIRKAHAIAEALRSHGATADQAAALSPLGRAMAAEVAGVRPASDATWACVVALLRVGLVPVDPVPAEGWAAPSRARWPR